MGGKVSSAGDGPQAALPSKASGVRATSAASTAQPYDFRFRLLPHDHHALDERVHDIERGEVIVHFADAEMYTYLSAIGNASALRSATRAPCDRSKYFDVPCLQPTF